MHACRYGRDLASLIKATLRTSQVVLEGGLQGLVERGRQREGGWPSLDLAPEGDRERVDGYYSESCPSSHFPLMLSPEI